MRVGLLALVAMASVSASAAGKKAPRLARVEFVQAGNSLRLAMTGKPEQVHALEPGDVWDGELRLSGQNLETVRVTVAHRNVLSLQDEGPHLDLVDWVFYESSEYELEAKKEQPGRFTVDATRLDPHAFPFVARNDFIQAVATHAAKMSPGDKEAAGRWTALARSCQAPQSYPCQVGVGRVTFRFYAGAEKKPFKELVLTLPQGC